MIIINVDRYQCCFVIVDLESSGGAKYLEDIFSVASVGPHQLA
jgi:hypothetical protein